MYRENTETLSISLPAFFVHFINDYITTHENKSPSIVIQDALQLLHEREQQRVKGDEECNPLITGVKPVDKKPRLDAKSAVARLRKLSQGIKWKSLDGMSIREAREEGRKY